MSRHKMRQSAWIVVAGLLLALFLGACAEVQVAQPPPAWPSIVTSEDLVQHYVSGLRIPGSIQEIRTRKGDANLWIPLAQISTLKFVSPAYEDYRQAEIVLVSGEVLRVDVEVNQILEGKTDVGYWNMPLAKVSSLVVGMQ